MLWDRLPPRTVEDCRYRSVPQPPPEDGAAVCNLLGGLGVPRELCWVRRDVCSACLRQFPPAPDCWNPVVASLTFERSHRALASGSLTAEERASLTRLKGRGSDHLPFLNDATPGEGPARNGEPSADSLWRLLPPPRPRGRLRVRTWAVGVVSSPRLQPTLDVTLGSLILAGWTAPHLFLDGTVRVPDSFAALPGVLRDPRVGCWPNYYLSLAELLMRHPDADAYLLVEDDARFYDREVLREYLEQMLWPDARPCLVSLYCPSIYSTPDFGWRPLRSRWTCGAQAFIFPRRVAQEFLLDPSVCGHCWGRWLLERGVPGNTDIVIGLWALRRRIPVWYPTPSLVQHIGATSTLGLNLRLNGERQADSWAGSLISR